jgi:RNA polymerase sigma factor (sigma-70 family)
MLGQTRTVRNGQDRTAVPQSSTEERSVPEATIHRLDDPDAFDDGTAEDVDAALADLWARYAEDRDPQLRDRLILHYAPLVKYVAGRVGSGLPAHVEQADLVSYGTFGLIDAITRFEPEREVKFESYAMARIRGAIIDELRNTDWIPRSVRMKARQYERAVAALEGQLQRSPTDEEVAEALDIAQAGFVHELPWGLDTRIGEQGMSLSGGQRQRLALARAVLARPKVLVLDDTLSALDVHTEKLVEEALSRVLRSTTSLVVAHRASTVMLADKVALLENGTISHIGEHRELLATVPAYRELLAADSEELDDLDAVEEQSA